MSLKTRVIFEVINEETGDVVSRDELLTLDIERPASIDDIGLNACAQHQLTQNTADKIIELQGPLINTYDICPRCKQKVSKRGKTSCEIHSLTTDHVINLQKYRCSHCNWISSDSIKSMYGTDTHTSLTKLQAELGCSYSYRKVVDILKLLSTNRSVNNKERIKRVLTNVGEIIEGYHTLDVCPKDTEKEAPSLIVHVDGAHVLTQEKGKRSFEVMTGTIYRPEDIQVINENENMIAHKTCIASAKEDGQETMKKMLVNAAKRAGMTLNTTVTAFSDGASNCQSVIHALSSHCLVLNIILDWFHIAMRFQNIVTALPEDIKKDLERAKWNLWHGLKAECFEKLERLIPKMENEKLMHRTIKLKRYLEENKDILVNYDERKRNDQPYTSQVAESTVENLVNSRCRQTGKMQWLREGTHSLLQVKCAHYSKSLHKLWHYVIPKLTQKLT